jgi:hypothetical protein
MAAKIKFSSYATEDILFAFADVVRTALGFSERNENMVRVEVNGESTDWVDYILVLDFPLTTAQEATIYFLMCDDKYRIQWSELHEEYR